MSVRSGLWCAALAAMAVASSARASTGVCDSNPPTTTDACINAIQASGGVVNDIFRDKNGRTASQLPSFGQVINIYPGCATMNCAGCNPGISNAPYDCPGQYACTGGTCTLATVGVGVNALDRQWGHPCRLTQHTLVGGCPQYGTCVADGDPQGYYPWEGLVFDLGGPSNQVAIFAENDHGPQPCESAEYTIFLTDNPQSQDIILAPTTTGADPQKWNRAVLKKVFTKGFVEVRAPDPTGHAACGDTALYSVEEDSMVTVYGLPCGINFRYAAVVAGNDGLDFPACQFHSSEAELDAVAGLTEDGAGVCPDADKDGYASCACAGAPTLCDCDDADPTRHPNAAEACDSPKDLNCNGVHPEPCAAGTACHASVCVPKCASSELGCPLGSTCQPDDAGVQLCIATDCTTGGCPPGAVCDSVTNTCRAACDSTVVCPVGQRCMGGGCVDLCRGVTCSSGFSCVDGVCTPPCSCFAGDVGCTGGNKCDRPDGGAGTNLCVAPSCVGVTCAAGKHCGAAGTCVGFCDGVACPPNEVCVPPGADAGTKVGCVNLCAGVACPAGTKCSNATGACVDDGTTDAGVDAGSGGGTGGGAGGGTGGAGGSGTGGSGGGGKFTAKSGCGCGALPGSDGMVLFGALALLSALGRRLARRERA